MIQDAVVCPFVWSQGRAEPSDMVGFMRLNPAVCRLFELVENGFIVNLPPDILEAGRSNVGEVCKEVWWEGKTVDI